MGEMRNAYKILVGELEKDHAEDLGLDGMIILECVLGKLVGRCGLYAYGSGQRLLAGFCEHGNEPSVSIKGWKFID